MHIKILYILTFCFIFSNDSTAESIDSNNNESPTIAIIDFKVNGITTSNALALSERLRSEIIGLSQFIVLERSAFQTVLDEQKFHYSGIVDDNSASEIGKVIGAQYVFFGSISKLGETYLVDSRLINVETATSIRSAAFEHKGEIDGLIKGMKSIASQISDANYMKASLIKSVPIYRFYHKNNKDHFYTKNASPKGTWKAQGIEFWAYKDETPGTVPIYRFYHQNNKDHFYTKNASPKGDWKAQGIAFWAYPE